MRAIDEADLVAELFDRSHIVGREYDRGSFVSHFENFLFQQIGIDGVETTERLVKNQQFGVMHNGSDKLYLLLHTFWEFFYFFLFPTFYVEFVQPIFHAFFGSVFR